jgi:circadian clock protein KaiB
VRTICDEYLHDRCELEVIDIYQDPTAVPEDLVLAAPTLIRRLPLPLRRVIGDMSVKEKVLVGLELAPKT